MSFQETTRRCRILVPLLLLLGLVPLQAQEEGRVSDPNGHSWYMYFGDHPFREGGRWGLHFDGQFRRQGIGQKWQQLLLRPGVNFDLNDNVQISGGYVFVNSYRYGDYPAQFNTPSHALWQQLILKQKAGKVGVTHRYRVEQRFLGVKVENEAGEGELDGYKYRNRFRYFVKGVVPLKKAADGGNKNYIGLYNEIFVNFGGGVTTIFDQNRSYAALGFRLSKKTNLEVGYMLQTLQQGNGRVLEFNHTFQLGIFSSAPFGWGD